ncbi:MAG: hypothetical protein COZ05_15035 [Armatimonadetes bacterium CG_4_10_14_3_um_filter_59_10]|nr:MAG: hypothetical protein COZ56_10380 [Armatimonadetes bacterium CG_4_8_14_3_um_filter_58_9]PIY41852.1 MAG: hypothetical protein COZ05_15035 [Armatimonadetes bacterium CG_4_10_14_3_um_filter_59_10]PJB62962.1 MAG: hypothetical protein CO095_17450 [Armatimonadetes bacterium CG_4_9_14_3_um_filter_58_7]
MQTLRQRSVVIDKPVNLRVPTTREWQPVVDAERFPEQEATGMRNGEQHSDRSRRLNTQLLRVNNPTIGTSVLLQSASRDFLHA